MQPTKTTDKLLLRRPEGDRAALLLQYPKAQADRMRGIAAGITFEGRKVPLALLAKRSLETYLDAFEFTRDNHPEQHAGELATLRGMLTDKPQPAKRRKTPKQ